MKDLVKPAAVAEVPAEQVEQEVVAAQNTRTPRLGNTCMAGGHTWEEGGGGIV